MPLTKAQRVLHDGSLRTTRFLISFLMSLAGFAFCLPSVNAQDTQPNPQCPSFSVECPSACPEADKDIIFRVKIASGQLGISPIFNWTVDKATIISGQGTDALTVRIDDHCAMMTATVAIGGLAPGCASRASCSTISDCCGGDVERKFDEFLDISCEDEMAHLDALAIELRNNPASYAAVIFYGGRSYRGRLARRGEREARANRIRDYLLKDRGIDADRIVMVTGGYREQWSVEVWIVPSAAQAPTPTPTVESKDMRFRRGVVKESEYSCGEF